jgi:hypothetical protein
MSLFGRKKLIKNLNTDTKESVGIVSCIIHEGNGGNHKMDMYPFINSSMILKVEKPFRVKEII